MNILIVEDEVSIANQLVVLLQQLPNTNIVKAAHSFDEGMFCASSQLFDVILVDIILGHPTYTGIDLCKSIRHSQPDIPLIIITGHHSPKQIETAFMNGVNDYITKPFDTHELQLRVQRWLLMTHKIETKEQLCYGGIRYHPKEHEFYYQEESLALTKTEKALLLILIRQPEELLSITYLQEKLWGDDDLIRRRNIRSNIQLLRKALAYIPSCSIKTIHGQGYMFCSNAMPVQKIRSHRVTTMV